MAKHLGTRMDMFFYSSLRMATSVKKSRFIDTCKVCDLSTTHRHEYTLRTQVPWHASPSTACVDWNKSEGFGKDHDCSHKGHRLISGKKCWGPGFCWRMGGSYSWAVNLVSCTDLLTLAAAQRLPKTLKISEEEYFCFREFDLRAGLEPSTIGDYMTLPPTCLYIFGHPAVMTVLLAKFTVRSKFCFV